jgi:hypothetical protein
MDKQMGKGMMYCSGKIGMMNGYKTSNFRGGCNMMGYGYNGYGMMGGYGWGFFGLIYTILLVGIIILVYLWIIKLWKSK